MVRRQIDPATGFVNLFTENIVSRTLYDKNDNVTQSIDPTGNATKIRMDLAGRWLQTEHADGGAGAALKTTAGSTHTITGVGSTVFFAPGGLAAYDGNSNLLRRIDENGSVVTSTFDENDLPVSESATLASGLLAETGASYEYDGLYRLGYAKTTDPALAGNNATDTNFAFNTLGEAEIDWTQSHVGGSSANFHSGYTESFFDELSRRHGRKNPGGFTRTDWKFDRKRRPTETLLSRSYGTGSFTSLGTIASYQYLGGGLLHRRRVQTHDGDTSRKIVSDFKRDNLLRLSSVRHIRDDDFSVAPSNGDALMGRFDYAYDANSMMKYEARWYDGDLDNASTAPDDLDVYFHDLDDRLSKVVYNVKNANLGSVNLAAIEADNNVQHSDRVIYDRRHSGTRQRVNWSRGPNNPPVNLPDSSTTPDQTTNYATSDDPNANPDSPAAAGAGSRHNYTNIGQVPQGYDNNRNLLTDGSREFRYNYKNELRRMWRKSDGATHGLVSEYRDDALGRQVMQKTWWELARRCYLDTRFELDINLDLDGDSSKLKLIDGGMTASIAAPPGQLGQSAQWSSRINRLSDNDAHYFDFLIDVPATTEGTGFCLGVLAYEDRQVRVFSNRYELWISGALMVTHSATTLGRHNLGICARGATSGEASGVWLDGSQIFGTTGVGLYTFGQPRANFTTCDPSPNNGQSDNGMLLLDFFAYVKSYLRTIDDSSLDGGSGTGSSGTGNGVTPTTTPRTSLQIPDGPDKSCTSYELALDGSGNNTGVPFMDTEGDATRQATYDAATPTLPQTLLHLVDGRQEVAVTIAADFGFAGLTQSVGVLGRSIYDAAGIRIPHINLDPSPGSGTKPSTSDGGAGADGLKAASRQTVVGHTEKIGDPAPDVLPVEAEPETKDPVHPPVGGQRETPAEGKTLRAAQQCACQRGNPAEGEVREDSDSDDVENDSDLLSEWTGGAFVLPSNPRANRNPSLRDYEEAVTKTQTHLLHKAADAFGLRCSSSGGSSSTSAQNDVNTYLQLVVFDLISLGVSVALSEFGIGVVTGIAAAVALIAHGTLLLDAGSRMSGTDLLGDTGRTVIQTMANIANIVQAVTGFAGVFKSLPGLIPFVKSLGTTAGGMKLALAGGGELGQGAALVGRANLQLSGVLDGIINAAAGITGLSTSSFMVGGHSAGDATNGKTSSGTTGSSTESAQPGTTSGGSVDDVGPTVKTPRVKSSTLRKKWEEATGKTWPKDPENPCRNQDVKHKKPLGDGGTNDVDNIEPGPHKQHMDEHAEDFKRWGARSKKN